VPVRRLSLADDVYESVKARVMDHAIAPGARVTIDVLARELDVSPTPVREALARLEADGLVRKRPLAGYTCTPLLTRTEFEELFEMRLLLEPAAAARTAARSPRPEVTRLRVAATLPDAAPDGGHGYASFAAFTAADARFHDLLAELSGNRMLRDAFARLHAHLHLHRLNFPTAHYGVSSDEHHLVVDAVGAGDPDRAATAMRAHLVAARERHLPFFDRAG